MLKKATLISTYGGLQGCLSAHPTTSNTSPLALPPRPRAARSRPTVQDGFPGRRGYATAYAPKGPDFRDNMNWPCRKTPHGAAPTPYEIFDIERTATYSKHKFYQLVKIYHPDRSAYEDAACIGITQIEKLERYRLVVQAHEILSDPVKRRAYDRSGAGWAEQSRTVSRHSRGYASSAGDGRTYGFGPDHDNSPFANATWEDWERWYRRHEEPEKRQPYGGTYAHSNVFASFVILLAVLSGVAQATRAGQYSGSLEEKAQAFTEETSRFLSTRNDTLAQTAPGADGRVKHFLERRDPTRYGLKDQEEETYRKVFGEQPLAALSPPTKSSPEIVSPD